MILLYVWCVFWAVKATILYTTLLQHYYILHTIILYCLLVVRLVRPGLAPLARPAVS